MSERSNFTEKTKRIIAGRAGYQCSFPDCKQVLIGPGNNNDEVTCLGECAHIYSASNGGPRGKDVLSDEIIASPANGIFLCRNHHKMIDTNAGNGYPPSVLLGYKARHEAMIARQLGKYPLSLYWIKGITLHCKKVFNNDVSLRLGHITHIYGTNNSGKTFFCKCIYNSIHNNQRTLSEDYSMTFDMDNMFVNKLSFFSKKEEGKRYVLNKDSFPICPVSFKVIYLSNPITFTRDNISDIAKCFSIDEETILSVLKKEYFVGLSTKDFEIRIMRKKTYLNRKVCISNKSGYLIELEMCASSEVARFLTDVGIILSRFFSYQSTVLYIIDWGNLYMLDDINMNEILSLLESSNNQFQTILISPIPMPRLCWTGWTVAKFINMVPNTIVEQDEF